jgi:hypothetical protein
MVGCPSLERRLGRLDDGQPTYDRNSAEADGQAQRREPFVVFHRGGGRQQEQPGDEQRPQRNPTRTRRDQPGR